MLRRGEKRFLAGYNGVLLAVTLVGIDLPTAAAVVGGVFQGWAIAIWVLVLGALAAAATFFGVRCLRETRRYLREPAAPNRVRRLAVFAWLTVLLWSFVTLWFFLAAVSLAAGAILIAVAALLLGRLATAARRGCLRPVA